MTLSPEFVLTPTNPWVSSYDPANPSGPYAHAYVRSYGGLTFPGLGLRLPDQVANDELLLGRELVDPLEEADITDWAKQIVARSVIFLSVVLKNMTGDEQLLLVYGLKKDGTFDTSAQFFVGTEFIRTEPIDDPTETVALLIDVPNAGDSNLVVYMRIAGGATASRAFFSGVGGFIL